MFGRFQWRSAQALRIGFIVLRVGALSGSMYGTGYFSGVTDHINKPEKVETTLLKEIMVGTGAKGVLPASSKEVARVTRVVQRLLPAAQKYTESQVEAAKKEFKAAFGESYDAAAVSGIPAGSEKQAGLDKIDGLRDSHQAMLGAWRVVVLDSPLQNAFVSETFPKRIFVCKGLLEEFKPNDEELAMVLGHEISHLIHGHSGNRILSTALLNSMQLVLLALLDPTGISSVLWEALGYIASESLASSFSRSHETEADMTGIQIVALACYDTKKGSNIFNKLAKLPGSHTSTHWNDTHPSSPERFAALQAASSSHNWRSHMHCYPLLRNLEAIGIKFY